MSETDKTTQAGEGKDYTAQIKSQQEEWDALGEDAQEALLEQKEALEAEDADEEESAAIIKEHLTQHNENKKNPAYLVRGAELMCSQGSNKRMMNLSPCHGVYIKAHAVVHELDCIQGDEENITWFGVCTPGEELETEQIQLIGDDGKKCHGKKCKPHILGTWMESYDQTKIVDNGNKLPKEDGEIEGCNTLTMDSFLVCKHGGIIMPINSGQDREVGAEEFDYATEEERMEALNRVQKGCTGEEEEMDCEDLLYMKLENQAERNVHGSEYEKEENISSEHFVKDYTDNLVEFVKQQEGFVPRAYNGGKTIAYGFDMQQYPEVKINYNSDGTVSEEEGERLLRIVLQQSKNQINSYLGDTNQVLDQNAYDAVMDLFYNRNSNKLTQEVIDAMAERDDEKVWSLLENFDYRYAYTYRYQDNAQEAKAYVERNPGLSERREEEYTIYQNGF